MNLVAFRHKEFRPVKVELMGESILSARDQDSQIGSILPSDTLKEEKLACRLCQAG